MTFRPRQGPEGAPLVARLQASLGRAERVGAGLREEARTPEEAALRGRSTAVTQVKGPEVP
ncbi:MAG: hypothetical protein KA712_20835 [Myxococcales bacterium]|nr:hypothetical protein [Myxococcales bacterium]